VPLTRRAWIWGALLLALSGAADCSAQPVARAGEYQVKAAYLYKFVNYIDWPPQSFSAADDRLVIGVAGADAMAGELASVVAGRSVNGRRVTVRKLQPGDPVGGLHMLFIGEDPGTRTAEVLAAAKGQAVLIVTESEHAFSLGSAINFVVVDDKVRFDVAPRPAESVNVKISSRLLAVARRVVSRPS
jgi:hypothetical protein